MTANELINKYIARYSQVVGLVFEPLDASGYTTVQYSRTTIGINVLEENGVLLLLSQFSGIPSEPSRQLQLYRRLLELSFLQTSDAAFSIDAKRDLIFLRSLRGLRGLDYDEFEDLLNTIGSVSEECLEVIRGELGEF